MLENRLKVSTSNTVCNGMISLQLYKNSVHVNVAIDFYKLLDK